MKTQDWREDLPEPYKSAPKLLEALKQAVDEVCECDGPHEGNQFKGQECFFHAAIAKAEGRD